MRRRWNVMMAALLWVGVPGVQAGTLDPVDPPEPTMHTLEEIYQKLLSREQTLLDIEALLALEGIGEPLVTPVMVMVGDAWNDDDPQIDQFGNNNGAVAYEYEMGMHEVTNAEYVEFLNAVDPGGGNALALYSINMSRDAVGGISTNLTGAYGDRYVVKPGFTDRPVVYVSFYDAMRFCNWLHNGAVAGADTENGAYTLEGGSATPSNGTTVERDAGARFTLPTEDEWYKAAYYEPGGDIDGYWLYPTRGNTAPPLPASPDGTNSANYQYTADWTTTEVGGYPNTVGFYGTFDMAGNVREWTETRTGPNRFARGGSFEDQEIALRSSTRQTFSPGYQFPDIGFRVSGGEPLVVPEMVAVGDAGNDADPQVGKLGSHSGSVGYAYRIGKYEVTNTEYAKFLNAVDPAGGNALALFNPDMHAKASGGILVDLSSVDGAKYAVKAGFAGKPVVYVSFYDAMRFCNWLHNGAVAGADTEHGAYTLDGRAIPSEGATVTRNAGAKFAVPTEDEWYKAAYYDPRTSAQGGPPGDDHYWLYPMQTDAVAYSDQPPGTPWSPDSSTTGNFRKDDETVNGYDDGFAVTGSNTYDDQRNYLTGVGAYTHAGSYYGTFDQGGNVYERNETLAVHPGRRNMRGGSWISTEDKLHSTDPLTQPPGGEIHYFGFRVSSP